MKVCSGGTAVKGLFNYAPTYCDTRTMLFFLLITTVANDSPVGGIFASVIGYFALFYEKKIVSCFLGGHPIGHTLGNVSYFIAK